MAVYAVGDIQGCLAPLQALLERVNFDPSHDQLWLCGDLVNRGPDSLGTLRYLYSIRHAVTIVLGNHDLHLLAAAHHPHLFKRKDTLTEIVDAPDSHTLLFWLRQQKLMHYDATHNCCLVHAGIAPQWSLEQALAYAQEVEQVLRDDTLVSSFLLAMYGNEPSKWDDSLTGHDRLRLITNYFTRMRFCTAQGELNLTHKLGPESAPEGFAPWFSFPSQVLAQHRILFGHWAALEGHSSVANAIALDTGCVWGGKMTLYNVETRELYHCQC